MAWTDERLEERFNSIDLRLDAVDQRFDEVNRRFDGVDRRFDEMDRKFDRRLGAIEADMTELHRVLRQAATGIIVTLFGVIAAILAKGG